VLGFIALAIAFGIGVKAGEIREELRGTFGGYYSHGYPMMGYQGYGGVPVTNVATGSATSTTVVPMMQQY
jgi:hypothetical protein